jgi:hypothetical protein
MSAHFFNGWISRFHAGRLTDDCLSLLLVGGSPEEARASFEAWLLTGNEADEPVPTKIERVVAAPVFGHLLTESSFVGIDWPLLVEEAQRSAEADQTDPSEHGYWVDCDRVVRLESLSRDCTALRQELPEDIRSGLNWAGTGTFFFLVGVLRSRSTPSPSPELDEPESEAPAPASQDPGGGREWRERAAGFPELAEKELVVVVRARNAVVAAWLWRRHAARTPLAGNRIRIDPWCGALAVEPES